MTATPKTDDRYDALIAALVELERHVSESGWDQRPRLFALVHTDDLIAAEPQLAADLGLRSSADGAPVDALTAIEQEHFSGGQRVLEELGAVVWPDAVFGCALAVERTFLPTETDAQLPEEPAAAAEFVALHPQREEVRVVVGVDREGHTHGVARLVSQPDELLGAANLVPGLAAALAHTLAAE
jgi:hypothetical protein